jgi:Origin recognition complex (ORC) subunit 4 C-terminus
LELGLITAIKKLIVIRRDAKTSNPQFNFEMVYDEYQKFVLINSRQGHGTGSLHFSKPVALKVFVYLT